MKLPLFRNYESSGAGIAKNAPQKKPFFRFWELVGRKFWKLMEVNMLMTVTFLPVVIAVMVFFGLGATNTELALGIIGVLAVLFVLIFGPSIAAVTKILRYYTLEKPCFLLDTYFKTFKSSFRQAFPLGLIDLLVAASVISGSYIYPLFIRTINESGQGSTMFYYVMFVLTLSIAIVVLMMSFYAYLMIVSTELSFRNILKNSLALSIVALKKNLITLVLAVLVMEIFVALTIYFPFVAIFVWFFVPTAYVAFMIVFNCYPVIQKYIINPYYAQRGELSPEMEFAQNAGENLFEDQGGKEKPVEPAKTEKQKNSKKRKVIS